MPTNEPQKGFVQDEFYVCWALLGEYGDPTQRLPNLAYLARLFGPERMARAMEQVAWHWQRMHRGETPPSANE